MKKESKIPGITVAHGRKLKGWLSKTICGCIIKTDTNGRASIRYYCSLHDQASELLEALDGAVNAIELISGRTKNVIRARTLIAKARGKS